MFTISKPTLRAFRWSGLSLHPICDGLDEQGTAAMADDGAILIGKSDKPENLLLKLANRHGLVTGATGTGKTVTLQVMAEGFARNGVPVFAADIKGDLSGIVAPGDSKPAFVNRAKELGLDYQPDQFTTVFWDVFGEQGHPVRATISEMGPLLLARLLDLNDTAEGVLNIAFRIADEQKLLLLDLKDLRAILSFVADNAAELKTKYGNVSATTVGTIQRALLVLENQKGDLFFGEPALEISDLMKTDRDGRGVVNILAADKLMNNPRLYATFLLWLLSELFEQLPEVGDLDKPKLVFFFDEAHLLFNDAPKALLTAVEQVVRLIRSKGVGVYFVTQNPLDIPDTVLAQLGNRVQHALRAFTPRDQKAVRAAATTFRQNPKIDTEQAITQLAVGEALISMLEGKGSPEMVSRALIAPPMAQVGPCSPQQRQQAIQQSPERGKYETMIDRDSAYEDLAKRKNLNPDGTPIEASTTGGGGILDTIGGWLGGGAPQQRPKTGPGSRGGPLPQSMTEKIITSAARSAATSIGRQVGTAILRGILGSMSGKR
jgi:DNA helicase HerA-like ATPase